MTDVGVDDNQTNKKHLEKGGFLSGLLSSVFFLAIIFSILWNWDGFWQTNVKPLKNAQSSIFPAKYNEEQLKLSRILKNNEVIDDIERRLKSHESKLIGALERANLARDEAVSQAAKAESELALYLEKENLKCRYYDSSLRMIQHLTKKYSEDELKRTISCTSKECEEILKSGEAARKVCESF